MSPLNAKCRTNFAEWLEKIADNDFQTFVFANTGTTKAEFGSEDFYLSYAGVSDGEPVNCHMVEARINGRTKDKPLKKLIHTSGSVSDNPTRLAFVLVPTSMSGFCEGQHVRQALKESPVPGKRAVNKVHVQWDPAVKLRDGSPQFAADNTRFVFERIPFGGYNVDGTKTAKKGKTNKK